MSLKISEIIEGWRNKLVPPEELKDILVVVRKERNIICMDCPEHSRFHSTPLRPDDHCTNCGCTLSAKISCLSCKCPLSPPLWGPVDIVVQTSQEEK